MNKFFINFIIAICATATWAQNDSITLIRAPWQIDSLDGIVLKSVHFANHEYFNSNQYIAFIEIPAGMSNRVSFAYESVRTRTSVISKKNHAIAAVNGSFFDMDSHNPVCYLRIDGKEVGINVAGVDTVNRKYYQYGTLVLDSGRVRILHTDSARFWERTLWQPNVMTAGPLLISAGKRIPQRNDLSFVNKRHNRTAVGIRPDGTVLLLVVDGRTKPSEGLTLDELQHTLFWLNCCDALNMDGGGSTTMYILGKGENGIVNHPSDNGRFDHRGERTVSNVIMVK